MAARAMPFPFVGKDPLRTAALSLKSEGNAWRILRKYKDEDLHISTCQQQASDFVEGAVVSFICYVKKLLTFLRITIFDIPFIQLHHMYQGCDNKAGHV
jgi:hypothetical protein